MDSLIIDLNKCVIPVAVLEKIKLIDSYVVDKEGLQYFIDGFNRTNYIGPGVTVNVCIDAVPDGAIVDGLNVIAEPLCVNVDKIIGFTMLDHLDGTMTLYNAPGCYIDLYNNCDQICADIVEKMLLDDICEKYKIEPRIVCIIAYGNKLNINYGKEIGFRVGVLDLLDEHLDNTGEYASVDALDEIIVGADPALLWEIRHDWLVGKPLFYRLGA